MSMRFLTIVTKVSYATFSLGSFNLMTRILYGVSGRNVIEAMVCPADLRMYILLAIVGLGPVIVTLLMLLLFSAKHRWVLLTAVTLGVATSIVIALSSSTSAFTVLAVYAVPQLPILLVKNRRHIRADLFQ
jgi:hypothetical protein